MEQQISAEFSEQTKQIQNLLIKLRKYDEDYGEVHKEWKIEEILYNFECELNKVKRKHEIIEAKMNRKWTKLYFFGKLSSGKTRLINGIIGDDFFILKADRTRNCFFHIRKSEDENYKIIYKDKEFIYQNKNEAITQIQYHFTENETEIDSPELLNVSIPIDVKNKIFTENVELIDTPGSGNKVKITEHIQNNVADADIVIFVLAHDITDDEERFFKFQVENSTKTDIFILINKWDETDQDNEKIYIKTHDLLFNKCSSLISQYNGPETGNINNRIYFVSANEIFDIRINKNNNYLSNDKQKGRYDEFLRFENEISEYIQKFESNKICRYKLEIEILKNDLNKLVPELSRNISEIDFESSIKIFEDSKNQILQFQSSIQEKCEKRKRKCEEKIKCSVTKMMKDFNVKEINKQNLEYYSKIDKSIEDFTKKLDGKYDNLLQQIENIQVGNEVTKYEMDSLEKIPVSQKTVRIYSDILIIGFCIKVSSTFFSIPVVGSIVKSVHSITGRFVNNHIYERFNKNEDYEEKIKKLNTEIHENDDEKLKILGENISKIENYLHFKSNKLLKQIDDKIKLRKDYKESLINVFN